MYIIYVIDNFLNKYIYDNNYMDKNKNIIIS